MARDIARSWRDVRAEAVASGRVDPARADAARRQMKALEHAHKERRFENMTYTTRDEAIQWEIIYPIELSGEVQNAWAEFDIDAIAEEVLGDHSAGYRPRLDADEFWRVVERHRMN